MIRIITVGSIKKKEVSALVSYYMKQMKRVSIETVKSQEQLFGCVKDGEYVVVLSEDGKTMDSVAFSELVQKKQEQHIVFLIADAFGFSDKLKKEADLVLSLSPMTMPHELAQLVLVEQVYRALQIQKGTKYHK